MASRSRAGQAVCASRYLEWRHRTTPRAPPSDPFAQATWNINDKFSVVGGVRYDFFSRRGPRAARPTCTPRIEISVTLPNYNVSLIYKPTARPRASASPTTSRRTPPARSATAAASPAGPEVPRVYTLDKELFQQPSELYRARHQVRSQGQHAVPELRGLRPEAHGQEHQLQSSRSTATRASRRNELPAEQAPLRHGCPTRTSMPKPRRVTNTASAVRGAIPPGNLTNATVPIGTVTRVSGLPEHLFNALVSRTSLTTAWPHRQHRRHAAR